MKPGSGKRRKRKALRVWVAVRFGKPYWFHSARLTCPDDDLIHACRAGASGDHLPHVWREFAEVRR